MNPIIVWTQKGCGPCIVGARMLRDALARKGNVRPMLVLDAGNAPQNLRDAWHAEGWSTPIFQDGALHFSGVDPERIESLA